MTGVDEDELAQINSETRFLTLELMKIAVKRRAHFGEVLHEFIQNVYMLKRAIKKTTIAGAKRRARRKARADPGFGMGFGERQG